MGTAYHHGSRFAALVCLAVWLLAGCTAGDAPDTPTGTVAGAANGDPAIKIVSPPDNVELPALDGGNTVSIVVSTDDAVVGGGGDELRARYLLDGEEIAVEESAVSFSFTDVEPGMHQLVAQLVTASGDPLPNAESCR